MNSATGLDAREIERQLRQLWKDLAVQKAEDGEEALVRSCVLNLMVYSSGTDVPSLSTGLAEVTSEHPSRLLLLLISERPGTGMNAHVTAQCHRFGRGRQVCCEQIWIEAAAHQGPLLPSAVSPLLVADLPVVLWWRAQPGFGDNFRDLLEISDRIIVDSSTLHHPAQALGELAALTEKRAPAKLFSDLAWGRLSGWRRQVAGFFDLERFRPHLERLREVEIQSGTEDRKGPPVRALLVLGWLASRLNWVLQKTPQKVADRGWVFEFGSNGRVVKGRIGKGKGQGLRRIRLFGSKQTDIFEVRRQDDHLVSQVTLAGGKAPAQLVRYEDPDEFQLLARELEIMRQDLVYEQALHMAAKLVQSPPDDTEPGAAATG